MRSVGGQWTVGRTSSTRWWSTTPRPVQFPKGIREPGARYLVTEVRESGRGGFYRAYGDIRRLG